MHSRPGPPGRLPGRAEVLRLAPARNTADPVRHGENQEQRAAHDRRTSRQGAEHQPGYLGTEPLIGSGKVGLHRYGVPPVIQPAHQAARIRNNATKAPTITSSMRMGTRPVVWCMRRKVQAAHPEAAAIELITDSQLNFCETGAGCPE